MEKKTESFTMAHDAFNQETITSPHVSKIFSNQRSTHKYKIAQNILARASTITMATSVAFIVQELIVSVKSVYTSVDAAYNATALLISYLILLTACIEPVVEIMLDRIQSLSNKYAKVLARRWYVLLDATYTACICLYFFNSFDQKSGMPYWYEVALPSFLIAVIANKRLRLALNLYPHTKKYHILSVRLIDTLCEAFKGFVLGYDVILEISYGTGANNPIWLSAVFGTIYALFHSTTRFLKISEPKEMSAPLVHVDAIFQNIFNVLTTLFFSFYILKVIAKMNPHETIQLMGYALIMGYIVFRSFSSAKDQPVIDKVAKQVN